MAKPVPAEGPWRSFSVSLRESDLARLDEARGGDNRSEWARAVLLRALDSWEPPPVAAPPVKAPPVRAKGKPARLAGPDPEEQQRIIDDVMNSEPDGTPRKRRGRAKVTTASELSKPPEERREAPLPVKRYSCPHPGKRIIGGWCPECDVTVHHGGGLPEGYVPPWAKDGAK